MSVFTVFRRCGKTEQSDQQSSCGKSSNEKQQLPSITSGHLSAVVTGTTTPRKRAKDTSGAGASPHTQVCRPAPKRQTVAGYGRRLNFCIEDDGMVIKFS